MSESAQYFLGLPPSRIVCVINLHPTKDFKQEFRGKDLFVPHNQERKLFLDYLEAEEFLSLGSEPQQFDNAGREICIGKPLKIVELTDEERRKHDPRNAEKAKEFAKEIENKCMICNTSLPTAKGLMLHVSRMHPDQPMARE